MNVGKSHLSKLGYTRSIQCGSSIQPAASICVVPHPSTNTHHHTEGVCGWESWWGLSSQAPKVLLYRAAVRYCTASIQWNCGANPKDWQHPTAAKGHTFTWLRLLQITGLPGSTVVKNLPANAGDIALTPGWENRKWQPTPVFLPGKFHEQRSLASYSPGGCKELDMTGHTHTYYKV